MSSSPLAVVLDELHDQLPTPACDSFSLTAGDQQTLAAALAAVPDPRRRRGVRYRFTPLLSAAVCAMLCGAVVRRDRRVDR
jgi:DDE_Tnp_1-associated